LVWIGYALAITFIAGQSWAFPDTPAGQLPCPAGKPAINSAMCQLEDILNDAKSEFRFLIGFILSSFVAMTIAIWRGRRQNYAALCGNAKNLAFQISSLVPMRNGVLELSQE